MVVSGSSGMWRIGTEVSADRLRRAKGICARRCAWLNDAVPRASWHPSLGDSGGPPTPCCIHANCSIFRPKSLVLYGESRLGKTVWARSLGSHIYTIGMNSGAELSKAENVDYAIFDDMRGGIKMFPSFKEWLGAQAYVTVKQLYREPKATPWGKPCIWLANTDPRYEMDPSDVTWMDANCFFVELIHPLFTSHANTE